MTPPNLRPMDLLRRLAMIREFSDGFGARCRRGERCLPVIRVTAGPPPSGMLEGLDGAARTVLESIEFRFHRD